MKIENIETPPKFTPDVIDPIKDSLQQYGLINPIQISFTPNANQKHKIISGNKRLRAAIELGWKEIATTIATELQESKQEEVHIHENIRRTQLEWYDICEQEKRLHDIRLKEHGVIESGPGKGKGRSNSKDSPAWTLADTAKELGKAIGTVSQDIKLANAIENNPHLKRVKDKMTALKLIKQAAKREIYEEEAGLDCEELEMDQVLLGDSADILRTLPGNLFDACITDPPWTEYARDPSLTADDSTIGIFKEVYRVLKGDAFCYIILSSGDIDKYRSRLPEFGFNVQSYPLIWRKSGTITRGKRAWEYARDYEPILLAVKGNPVLTTGIEISSILDFPSLHNSKLTHPHEKPLNLLKTIMAHCSFQGSKILDPFSGSGSTLMAAKEISRRYVGIEKNKEFFDKIVERLK